MTGRCSVLQAACVYSLIRSLRIGFRRICCVDVGHGGAGTVAFVTRDVSRDALVRPGGVVMRMVFARDGVQVLTAAGPKGLHAAAERHVGDDRVPPGLHRSPERARPTSHSARTRSRHGRERAAGTSGGCGRCRFRAVLASGRCGGTAGPRSGRPGRGGVGPFAWVPADLGYGDRQARRSSVWRASPSARVARRPPGEWRRARRRSGLAGKGERTSRSAAASVGRWDILLGQRRVPPYAAHRRFARRLSVPSGRQRQRQGDLTPCHF